MSRLFEDYTESKLLGITNRLAQLRYDFQSGRIQRKEFQPQVDALNVEYSRIKAESSEDLSFMQESESPDYPEPWDPED